MGWVLGSRILYPKAVRALGPPAHLGAHRGRIELKRQRRPKLHTHHEATDPMPCAIGLRASLGSGGWGLHYPCATDGMPCPPFPLQHSHAPNTSQFRNYQMCISCGGELGHQMPAPQTDMSLDMRPLCHTVSPIAACLPRQEAAVAPCTHCAALACVAHRQELKKAHACTLPMLAHLPSLCRP